MRPKVLIIDDEPEIVSTLKNYLTLEGYDVIGSSDPTKVMDVIVRENVGVVISDIMMPQMNGLDLIRDIKKCSGLIQVIFITGYVTLENILTAFRLGANNMYFKPLNNLELVRIEVELAFAKLDRIRSVIRERALVKDAEPASDSQPRELRKAA